MKIKTLIAGASMSLVILALFGGCATAPAPDKPADEVIKAGLANLSGVTSYKYDVAFSGDVDDPTSGKVNFNFKMNGAVDVKDMKDPKVSINLDGMAKDGEGMGGSAKAEMMMNKEAVYFNLKSLDLGEEDLLPPEVNDYMGKWWMVTLPPEVMEELESASPTSDLQSEEFKKMLEKANFFSSPEYVGTENVMGDPSWHYKVALDKKAFIEFAKDAAEAEGESISAAEMAEAEEALKNVNVTGDVYVSSTSKVLNQFKGSIDFDMEGSKAMINMSLTLGDINKPVTLSLPSGAEEFPIEDLMGPLMMMSGMGDPSMMYDDSMMGEYGDFDPSMYDESMFDESMMDMDPAMFDESMMDAIDSDS